MVTTLGDWVLTNEQNPNGKFINYHAGPAPTIDIQTCPALIRENISDPIYLLIELLGLPKINEISECIKKELMEEIL